MGGRSLVCRLIDQILSCNRKTRIIVVAGHQSDLVRKELRKYPENVSVVNNDDYLITNNMESCRIAIEKMGEKNSCLIINGDCIYSDKIVKEMYESKRSTIGTDSSRFTEENMKILSSNGHVKGISKKFLEIDGAITSIDIYSFSADDIRTLAGIMEDFHSRGDLNQWTEVAIHDLLISEKSLVESIDFEGEKWMEIDDIADLEKAREMWS